MFFFILDNLSDIFDILMQKENMDDATGIHQIVRKSRGPQLRLRFGKRSDYVSLIFKAWYNIYYITDIVFRKDTPT